MIVTCPACHNRYTADPNQMGPGRRKVRCAGCKHVWELMGAESEAPRRTPPPQDTPVYRTIGKKTLGIMLALVLLAGSILGRGAIVSHWPALHEVYARMGFNIQRPGAALRIIQPAAFFTRPGQANKIHITVTGTLINTSNETQLLPPLEITTHHQPAGPGSPPTVLERWRHPLAHSRILPKESIAFELHKTLSSGAPVQVTLGF